MTRCCSSVTDSKVFNLRTGHWQTFCLAITGQKYILILTTLSRIFNCDDSDERFVKEFRGEIAAQDVRASDACGSGPSPGRSRPGRGSAQFPGRGEKRDRQGGQGPGGEGPPDQRD